MFTRNSQMIIGLFIVVALAVAGSLLLSNNVGPAAIQSQSGGPTPPPPDFTAFAESYCCDSGTPKVMTPSTEQVALWTEVAQTQEARFTDVAPTSTPLPSVKYLDPSGSWATYTDPDYGYKFDYPDNWFIVEEMVGKQKGIAVQNSSPDEVNTKGSESPNPDKIKIIIFPMEDMGPYKTLENYLNDPKRALNGQNVIQLRSEISSNGYQVLWKQETLSEVFLDIYLTNGVKVFAAVAPAASKHTSVVEHLLNSFVIP